LISNAPESYQLSTLVELSFSANTEALELDLSNNRVVLGKHSLYNFYMDMIMPMTGGFQAIASTSCEK
jgi:hypothetical protein